MALPFKKGAPPPFGVGKKQVFLPSFVLTLLRTPSLPPTFASFLVPLNLNKFDIRDYLFHVYDIRVTGVRSFIQQQRVLHDNPNAIITRPRKWFRPKAKKIMTVEMERPFAWPEVPESFEPWDKQGFDAATNYQRELGKKYNPQDKGTLPSSERESIAEQAKRILKGEDPWVPRMDYPNRTVHASMTEKTVTPSGREEKQIESDGWQEVEQEVTIPKEV